MSFVREYTGFLVHAAAVAGLALLYLLPSVARRMKTGRWNLSQLTLNLLTGWAIYGWWWSWWRSPRIFGAPVRNPHVVALRRTMATIFLLGAGLTLFLLLAQKSGPGRLVVVQIPPSHSAVQRNTYRSGGIL